jgi:hypothetical protein
LRGELEKAEQRAAELQKLVDSDQVDCAAGKLIDAWCAEKGRKIPWAKAVQIVAIVTKQSDEERDRLLHMADEGDGKCEMCGHALDAEARIAAALAVKVPDEPIGLARMPTEALLRQIARLNVCLATVFAKLRGE